jgi:hypothetical protein
VKAFLLFPDQDFDFEQPLPPHAAALIQDLELTTLFNAMALGDKFLYEIVQQVLLHSSDSPETIRYRQEILQDCLKQPQIVRAIYRLPIEARENKQRRWLSIFTTYPSGILSSAREMLEMYVHYLRVLRTLADEHATEFTSAGFTRFFAMIQEELNDEFFAQVQTHLGRLKFRQGVLLSARLGPGNEGTDYVLRQPTAPPQHWFQRVLASRSPEYTFSIHPRDEAGARALSELRDRGINLVANALAQSAEHIENFFVRLQHELAFYMGCLNLAEQLDQLHAPIAFPVPVPAGERRHTFKELYDVTLALTMQQAVVANTGDADGKELFIITGANQGGKSTFLRSIGLAQLMMQSGMFVPAEALTANVCRGLFTHYKREEDTTMKSGKFDEELSRMSQIVEQLTPDALVLFNESFAATNEREGSEIARQIVRALLEKRIKIFFVTHLYEFARSFYEQELTRACFLRAERQADGSRSFKLLPGSPLETSYGEDLYHEVFAETR